VWFTVFSRLSLNVFLFSLKQEVDLLLNDGSKHINVAGWRKNVTLPQRVDTSRRRSRRCLLMSLALAKTPAQQVCPFSVLYTRGTRYILFWFLDCFYSYVFHFLNCMEVP
jgi:hypothetical protein